MIEATFGVSFRQVGKIEWFLCKQSWPGSRAPISGSATRVKQPSVADLPGGALVEIDVIAAQ
jgi:hypothetical protein